jgi:phenylpyruvate tautomerase PptA (4-oxalocrotonate tautomerase family)
MPLIRIDLIEGRTDDALRAILDTAHEAVLEAFGVPPRDRYQIITEHKPGRMVLLDTGLGFERDDKVIVVQVFSSPRTTEMKQAFYRLLTDKLEKQCDIPPNDVLISIMTNSKEDWSFGFGRAQFLTGEL